MLLLSIVAAGVLWFEVKPLYVSGDRNLCLLYLSILSIGLILLVIGITDTEVKTAESLSTWFERMRIWCKNILL